MELIDRLIHPPTARMFDALYRHYFEVVRADEPRLLDDVYRLRYQVYAGEHSFENPEAFSDRREQDEYDDHARHILLRHRRSQICVGTARLIVPKRDNPATSFPVQELSSHPVFHDAEIVRHAGEFSRLAISREHLKQSCDQMGAMAAFRFDPTCRDKRLTVWLTRRVIGYLSVGLMAGIVKLAALSGYPVLYAVMEPFLIRKLRRIGILFPVIDAAVEYHGLRHPCGLPSLHEALTTMKGLSPASWQIMSQGGRTQDLALAAETRSEAARRAVQRAKELAGRTVPVSVDEPASGQAAARAA